MGTMIVNKWGSGKIESFLKNSNAKEWALDEEALNAMITMKKSGATITQIRKYFANPTVSLIAFTPKGSQAIGTMFQNGWTAPQISNLFADASIIELAQTEEGMTAIAKIPTPSAPVGRMPILDKRYESRSIVHVAPGLIREIPSNETTEDKLFLIGYLDKFTDITGRPYVSKGQAKKEGKDVCVCGHFAEYFAKAINNDPENPGYVAYFLGYLPTTITPAKRGSLLTPDTKMSYKADRARGPNGNGHAINIIEAPNGESIYSKYWIVDPQGPEFLGVFIGEKSKPTPPLWFIYSFLGSNFNRQHNFTEGDYKVDIRGSYFDFDDWSF